MKVSGEWEILDAIWTQNVHVILLGLSYMYPLAEEQKTSYISSTAYMKTPQLNTYTYLLHTAVCRTIACVLHNGNGRTLFPWFNFRWQTTVTYIRIKYKLYIMLEFILHHASLQQYFWHHIVADCTYCSSLPVPRQTLIPKLSIFRTSRMPLATLWIKRGSNW